VEGYSKSNFTGNLEEIGNGWVYSIDSESEKTWLRINIDKDEDKAVLYELQYIIENLRSFIESISKAAMTGTTDGIYVSRDEDD
jgi:hypothetical protein